MRVLGLIPARGGSKTLPRKNLAVLAGRPLITWTITAALNAPELDRVIVSTDDDEIAAIARQWNADVPFLRPAELARDQTPSIDVVEHALAWLAANEDYRPDYVMLLQPTAPLRTTADIRAAVAIARREDADAVVSVFDAPRHPFLIHRLTENGTLGTYVESTVKYPRRQDYPAAYAQNGALFLVKTSVLLSERLFVPKRTHPYVMPDERSVDIDTALDLQDAEVRLRTKSPAVTNEIEIRGRKIGPSHPPLVIAEIGINHEGDFSKAIRMVDDALAAGCECVKFQSHVIEDEMVPNDVIPGNASESIWDIMSRCALSEDEERSLKAYVESKGMIFLSTPFSRAAAVRLEAMGVEAYKIGSGECNNYPLIRHIAAYGKPVILSTGMNDVASIAPAVEILREQGVPFGLLHCTSMYPTPYNKVRLGALDDLRRAFPDAVLGLSDHSEGIYTCLGAVALGASILEKHFTSDKSWPGPDVPISMDPNELRELVQGSRAVALALGGGKGILPEEQPTIDFAYACVVATRDIAAGELFTDENLWVKRPGTGEIKAVDFPRVIGKRAKTRLAANAQIRWDDIQ